jgi:uroporphyrinogen-III synthase
MRGPAALVLTRPQPQADEWRSALAALAVPSLVFPLLHIEPVPDRRELHSAWAVLASCALVMFVSANAVSAFFAAAPPAVAWPLGTRAGSTGPGTSAALRRHGVPEACIVEPDVATGRFDSEALWQRIAHHPWHGQRVLVVRGEEGRDWLAEQWRAGGAQVDFVAAYRRLPPPADANTCERLRQLHAAGHPWHFSSSEAVGHLAGLSITAGLPAEAWLDTAAWASHARIVEAARAAGFARVAPVAADAQALAQAWRAWAGHLEFPPP